jgi:D-threo-aldose 1-dehydrogenase
MVSLVTLLPPGKHARHWLRPHWGCHVTRARTPWAGVAPLGKLYARVSEDEAESTLAAAIRRGIQWFDVAPLYGHGLAEIRLGKFLREAKTVGAVVSTKVGRVLETSLTPTLRADEHFVAPLSYQPVFDYSRAGIERSYEESLRRLGLERVQLLLLHDIDRISHPVGHRALVRQVLDEALPMLHR